MKTIVVSDTHLTAKFDQNKYKFLKSIFATCDQLIVNGDFWSAYCSSFDEFVNSEWKKLFPLMLSKKTIYLFGNHDREKFMDHRMNLFSVEQHQRYKYSTGAGTFQIEHGHLFFKHQSFSDEKLLKLYRKIKIDESLRVPLEALCCKNFGIAFISKLYGYMNANIKDKHSSSTQKNDILVVGHTHIPEDDRALRFVNTGFINFGFGWYLEINNRESKLVELTY